MTLWLKQQLAVWTGAAIIGGAILWNVGGSRAQSANSDPFQLYRDGKAVPRQKLTRDEAAKLFIMELEKQGLDERLGDCISFHSRARLKHGAYLLVRIMSEQWKQPQHTFTAQSQTKKTAVVIVKRITSGRPLILVEENGFWGVDLIATYAKWNNLKGRAKAEEIYELTGDVLNDLPKDEFFRRNSCQLNLKQIARGLAEYSQDYDGFYPPAQTDWTWALQPYVKSYEVYRCPSLPKGARYGYAFNTNFLGSNESQTADTVLTVSIYETSILKRNAFGTGENPAFRHLNGANYAFADGHVKWFPKTQIPSFKLKP